MNLVTKARLQVQSSFEALVLGFSMWHFLEHVVGGFLRVLLFPLLLHC